MVPFTLTPSFISSTIGVVFLIFCTVYLELLFVCNINSCSTSHLKSLVPHGLFTHKGLIRDLRPLCAHLLCLYYGQKYLECQATSYSMIRVIISY